MDLLSIAASVTGLLTASAKVAGLLQTLIDAPNVVQTVRVEINHFVVVLAQLQPYVMGSSIADQSRTSLIEVQQIQIILTGCVLTFSELQSAIDGLGHRSTFRARVRWVLAESSIKELVKQLRDHKSSLNLILTTLTCLSISEAVNSIQELRIVIDNFIRHNSELYDRVRELEAELQLQRQGSSSCGTIRGTASSRFSFETVLFDSRIYRRVLRRGPSQPGSAGWSVLSGLSLSGVSNVSVFHLAITRSELSNPECYPTSPSLVSIMTIQQPESPITTASIRGESSNQPLRAPVELGANPKGISDDEQTQFIAAAAAGHHQIVRQLLKLGVNIAHKDSSGNTALHHAVRNHHIKTVRVLDKYGASRWEKNNDGKSAIDFAYEPGILPILLKGRMPDRWLLREYQQVLESFSAVSEGWEGEDNTADDE